MTPSEIASRRQVFVDTAAWLALINVDDDFHDLAKQVRKKLQQDNCSLITSDFVLLEVADTWSHLWYQFNSRSTKPELIPNYWTWDGKKFGEVVDRPIHPLSILSKGVTQTRSTPQHNQRQDEIVLPGRQQICGVMTIEEISRRKLTKLEQLTHLFEVIECDDVIDTEFVIQIDTVSSQALDRQLEQTIADRLGLGDIFQGVLDFLEGIENTNDKILEVKTPDWNIVKDAIEDNDTRGKELGRQLENRESDSFSINRDEAEQVQRLLIQDLVSTSTTSKEAQEATAASLIELEDALKKSGDLSQDSASTDVSQQILQNLSEQSGINTQLLGTISSQNIQAQKDRANQINLALQQARHMSMESTRRRRESSAASDLGRNAWGVVGTPTFLYEETE